MIIRTEKTKAYSIIANAPLEDKELSWEARGMLAYLLSKPDGWQTKAAHLINASPAGETKVLRILRELEDAQYLVRHKGHDENGRFTYDSIVRETRPGFSGSGKVRCIVNTEEEAVKTEKKILPTPQNSGAADTLSDPAYQQHYLSLLNLELETGKNVEELLCEREVQDRLRRIAEYHFRATTLLRPPVNERSAGALWWGPLRTICERAQWQEKRILWLITQAVGRMEGMTIKSPKSILAAVGSVVIESDDKRLRRKERSPAADDAEAEQAKRWENMRRSGGGL